PEVSSLDFTNAIVLQGFRVPALTTRRTQTEVELQDGQTFAIAGLMNNTLNNTMSKIPGIGDIPVLGYLFRSRAYQKNQTELVVMITPQIVRRGSTGVSAGVPSLVEPYLDAPKKTYAPPAPYTGSPVFPPNQGKGGAQAPSREPNAAPQPPAAAQPKSSAPAQPQSSAPAQPFTSRPPASAPQQMSAAPAAQPQSAPPPTVQAVTPAPVTPKVDSKEAKKA